ncbi:uncharacterized protein EV420DRAFT_1472687 [Desarmillaria tabescens]|uniref:Uncharacterized protein n=1 Tax=Armillaria tabescens TaxID=1929756 RepID=A0AA39NPT7_ARMTA|nr:uncharacterized protein EV420DRAFT_1472687 [Desarmillaria tabescens]KAK0469460.1 hypothetical protein EV420DRAFT_1472687 [Desarmillaria tabescens]
MPLKLAVADCDILNKVLPECKDAIRKAQVLAQRNEETQNIQLSRFVNVVDIERSFSVESFNRNDRKYLMWKDDGEEVVLHFQGIVSQVLRPANIRQFIQVVSDDADGVFEQARAAEKALQKFMWQYRGNPEWLILHDSIFGGIHALMADSKLLTAPSQPVGTTVPITADMEERGALTRICMDSKHRYTDDNAVQFLEWQFLDNKTMTLLPRESGCVL